MSSSPPLPPGLSGDPPIPVPDFDRAEPADAAAELMPCCASRRWVSELVGGRPYGSVEALITASDDVLARLDWVDVAQAIRAHPRTADRALGNEPDAGWSAAERLAAGELAARLAQTERAYDRKFGHALLVAETGLSAEETLEAVRRRLKNDPFTERAEVGRELAKIVRQRLAKAFR